MSRIENDFIIHRYRLKVSVDPHLHMKVCGWDRELDDVELEEKAIDAARQIITGRVRECDKDGHWELNFPNETVYIDLTNRGISPEDAYLAIGNVRWEWEKIEG